MKINAYLTFTGVLFAVIAVVHVLRLVYGWPVAIATWQVPFEVSWIGLAIALGLSLWSFVLWRRRS